MSEEKKHKMPDESWKKKLYPGRFPQMSGKMATILGYICDEHYTDPAFAEIIVTSDGCFLGRVEGDCGCNDFLGNVHDLHRNWNNLVKAAGLNEQERIFADNAYSNKIRAQTFIA